MPENDLAAATSGTLFQAATTRLESEGRDAMAIKMLVEGEPGHPDDWLAFLILADRSQLEPLLELDAP